VKISFKGLQLQQIQTELSNLYLEQAFQPPAVEKCHLRFADKTRNLTGLASGNNIVVPSSAFFLSRAASVRVASIGRCSFQLKCIRPMPITRTVKVLGSRCFANSEPLSSISFENDSRLRFIESNAFFLLLSDESQFPDVVKSLVHHVCRVANYFHQFHQRMIHD
jgi:hypothetical protein